MLANPFDRGKLRHDGGESGDGQQGPRLDLDLESGVVRIAPPPQDPDQATADPDQVTAETADQADPPGTLGKRD